MSVWNLHHQRGAAAHLPVRQLVGALLGQTLGDEQNAHGFIGKGFLDGGFRLFLAAGHHALHAGQAQPHLGVRIIGDDKVTHLVTSFPVIWTGSLSGL